MTVVTWSPSVTLVPTRACFNRCDYCSFRRPADQADALESDAAARQLRQRPLAAEVLLLSGEVAPETPGRRAWFRRLRHLSRLALAHGRLPHTNAGPLSLNEMAQLGRLNASMGLMLEGLGPAYDALHRHAPSKRQPVRIAQLEQAGRLAIPFTTGLLLGVGESRGDRRAALRLIADLQAAFGHIQEVILQPHRAPGPPRPLDGAQRRDLLGLIETARGQLPESVRVQLPPNLWPLEHLHEAVAAGVNDLGGIDVQDVINPAYPQPRAGRLLRALARHGITLRPRLCVHEPWLGRLPPALRRAAEAAKQLLASAPEP
jgi:FO synthase subunit 1